AFGLPVVAFDVEGPRDVLNFGEFGQLIALGNVDEMLAKLNELIDNKALRQYWQEKSLHGVTNYEIEKVIAQWQAII
ncbi:MAG: glycosyltransferase, partial [Streptococcaceae bacterium]|nr:glycosyltransferase [Streptococcaceae bacterium]